MITTIFNVAGMSCAHCKAAVEDELNRLPGVKRSEADVERGTVEVAHDDTVVDTDKLISAIKEAGYTVTA